MDIRFYYVNSEYINFLKMYETNKRGFTCVPNVEYSSRNKFFYGVVLQKNGMNYFVPVSHSVKQSDNSIIIKSKPKRSKALKSYGSLKFQYMIPVPNKMLKAFDFSTVKEESTKRALEDELAFCKRNRDKIFNKANETYNRIINSKDKGLIAHSCDFHILEQAYKDFCQVNNLENNITDTKTFAMGTIEKLNAYINVLEQHDKILAADKDVREMYAKAEEKYLQSHEKAKLIDYNTPKSEQLDAAKKLRNEYNAIIKSDSKLLEAYIKAKNKIISKDQSRSDPKKNKHKH